MSKAITKALATPAALSLLGSGLKFTSTPRQIENGTIVLAGKVKRQAVNYKITTSGAVLSNEYTARRVTGSSDYKVYQAGLKAAAELLAKRIA